ncbi:MAG: flagellin [Planctomycetota bacterium]
MSTTTITNIQALVGANALAKANQALNETFVRLSTGQAINRGADDPAGLIASEQLSRELAALDAESRSVERSRAVADTADGALAEVSKQLADARGLAVQAANTGAMSDAEREAIELEYASIQRSVARSLDTATFNGRALFDGTVAPSDGASLRSADDGGEFTLPDLTLRGLGEVVDGGTSLTLADTVKNGKADLFDPQSREAGVRVLDAAIAQISGIRGEIGAFTSNTLGPAQTTIRTSAENLSAARSGIRDSDFAALSTDLSTQQTLGAAAIGSLLSGNANQARTLAALTGSL